MKQHVQILRKASTGPQLVIFPFGGGSGYSYMELIKAINADVEIIVINPPGRLFDKTKPLESISEMVTLYTKELFPIIKNGSYFFGHSIGGLIAYETLKKIQVEIEIRKIIISGANPPHRVRENIDMHSDMGTDVLIKKSAAYGGLPHLFADEPELLEMFISGLKSDLRALENYESVPLDRIEKIDVECVISYGEKDTLINTDKMHEWEYYLNCLEFNHFSGNHFYILQEPHLNSVAQLISHHIL